VLLAVHLSTWIQSVDWVGTPVPYKSVGQFLISARGAEGTQPWPKSDKPHCKKRINRTVKSIVCVITILLLLCSQK
jgi:hypothetical protein